MLETIAREQPASQQEAAQVLARCAAEGVAVRPLGAGTKAGWGTPGVDHGLELRTGSLDRIVEHNVGDLTAVLEAGVPLARAQETFTEAGQTLSLDPPLGEGDAATVGGALAAGDSGPLRHRYGAGRDLVVGMTMALSDGTVARSGGKVIKNVAGYDLAKLLTGSFGTLGVILEVAVRLHPRPAERVTLTAPVERAADLGAGVSALAHSHLELECLDASWSRDGGEVLALFAGVGGAEQAETATRVLAGAGLEASVCDHGEAAWRRQREGQRSGAGVVIRVSGVQSDLALIAGLADESGASLVARGALGVFWLKLEGLADAAAAELVGELRARLAPRPCVVLDAPEAVRRALDVWGEHDSGRLALARRIKERFDPSRTLNPGLYVGGI